MSAAAESRPSASDQRMTASSHLSPFPPSLVGVLGEHEWTSEVGEGATTAECRMVGLTSPAPHRQEVLPLAHTPVGDPDSGLQPFLKCKLTYAVHAVTPPPGKQPTSQAAARR